MIDTDTDGYCAATNGASCYTVAIREIRLETIRIGLLQPDHDDPEEMAAALPMIVDQPAAYRWSA